MKIGGGSATGDAISHSHWSSWCTVLFENVIWKKMWSGHRSVRGLLTKPMTRQTYGFFMYQGYDTWKNHKANSPPPSAHLRLFWQEKNIKFLLPATTIENITRVNSLHNASNSLILLAINALIAICLIHLLPLAKF
jgi:hypothetical protein